MELVLLIILALSIGANCHQYISFKRLKERHEMIMEIKDSTVRRLDILQEKYNKLKAQLRE